jgi:mannose-6-phosphate isomerase-like protein (cupin superfamily)/DNA-binding XRE family transcriptional regulator
VLRPLAAPFVGKHMDPFEAALTPVPKARTPFLRHHHEEFLCILSGTIECLLDTPDGAVREQLSPGDCMYVRSHLLHGLRACAAGPAQAIRVLCAALGDSDLDRVEGDAGLAAASEVPDLAHTGARSHSAVPMKLGVLRQRFGWSLAEGASALGVSQRKLTAIERGRRPVGLDLLVRACSVYRKPVEYFLGSALNGPPYYSVHRARALRHLRPRIRRAHAPDVGPGYVYKSLADRFGARGMYPYYVKVPPHAPESTTLHEHHGQEFVYVLNGEVTLVTMLDGTRTTETLGRGDACYLDSSVPHRFIAAPSSAYGRRGAEVLGVFWCPLGEPYLFGDSSGGARTHRAARIRESSSKHDSG